MEEIDEKLRGKIEKEHSETIDAIINKYHSGELSIFDCTDQNVRIAKEAVHKYTEMHNSISSETELYEKLKLLGWNKIREVYEHDQNKFTDAERKRFLAILTAYSTQHCLSSALDDF